MRQVTYTRPKDWVDPFQASSTPQSMTSPQRRVRPSTVSGSPSRQTLDTVSTHRSRGNGSHVNRIKSMRKAQSAGGIGTSSTIDGNCSSFEGKEKEYEDNDIHEMASYINDDMDRFTDEKKKTVEEDDEYEEDDDFEQGSGWFNIFLSLIQ
jgi:hypothetical protein